MATAFRLLVVMIVPAFMMFAQVPNGGFEQWAGGNPVGWFTDNVPGFVTPVTQSSTSHSGSSAARGEVVNFAGNPFPPVLGTEFPVSQRYATISGWYQFLPQGGDQIEIAVLMLLNGSPIGDAAEASYETASSYTSFDIPITYFTSDTPDSCFVEVFITGDTLGSDPHLGSYFLADDFSLSGVSSVVDLGGLPLRTELFQNYPNPFNPTTTIEYDLQSALHVSLRVYNLLGQQVATLVDDIQSPGRKRVSFNAASLSSGSYFYQLVAGTSRITKKLTITR